MKNRHLGESNPSWYVHALESQRDREIYWAIVGIVESSQLFSTLQHF